VGGGDVKRDETRRVEIAPDVRGWNVGSALSDWTELDQSKYGRTVRKNEVRRWRALVTVYHESRFNCIHRLARTIGALACLILRFTLYACLI
jgi:hypothetical protein